MPCQVTKADEITGLIKKIEIVKMGLKLTPEFRNTSKTATRLQPLTFANVPSCHDLGLQQDHNIALSGDSQHITLLGLETELRKWRDTASLSATSRGPI